MIGMALHIKSGTYTINTTNQFGCDSTATLNLTINSASSSSFDVTACDSYVWHGEVYTESGTYTLKLQILLVVIQQQFYNLTINSASSSSFDATACDSYVWHGEVYTESGTYTFNTTNQFACDQQLL